MKNLLIASAAAAALFALPAAASAATGFVGLTYSDVQDFDSETIAIDGAVVLPVGGLNLQIDGNVAFDADETSESAVAATAHLFTRNDSWAAGAFVTGAEYGNWLAGVEGAKYYDRVTLSGSLGTSLNDDFIDGLVAADVGVKFFATDNFTVGARYLYIDADDLSDNLDGLNLNAEYQLANPVSFTAGYTTFNDLDLDIWSIGARWNFGTSSLKQRDREGASMRGLSNAMGVF